MNSILLPLNKACKVIKFHPEGLWAIDKATGVLSHPNKNHSNAPSLLTCSYDFKKECYLWKDTTGVSQHLYLIHRLDSATSGVMLASSCYDLALELKKSFAKRSVDKTYYAVVDLKHPKPVNGMWKDSLVKNSSRGNIRVTMDKDGSTALTRVTLERIANTKLGKTALLKLMPKTGRTHQLRVQCAKRGMPIIGDRTYGNFELNRKFAKLTGSDRLFLHAAKVVVNFHSKDKSKINWEANSPIPSIFKQLAG
jgi:tRNA pseudouridine65 synthase